MREGGNVQPGFTPSLKFRQSQSVPSKADGHTFALLNMFPSALSWRQKNQSKFSAGPAPNFDSRVYSPGALNIYPSGRDTQSIPLYPGRRAKNNRNFGDGAGFTLIEIVIAISIFILLAGAASVSFVQSRRIRDLTTAGQSILTGIRLAQSRTLAGEENSQWGIKIEQIHVTVFQGTSFAGSSNTEVIPLPSTIEIVNISLTGGTDEAVFKRIEGTTDQAGTFDVRVINDTSLIFPITIETSGKTYRSGATPVPTGTRLIDTRHRAFQLGWSIQTSATTTLTFENPPYANTVLDIPMDTYFDAPKTVFDWSGSVAVGTSTQTLRIHTTALSSFDTTLHIDRDCRKNTKRLTIAIDSKTIATYELNCTSVAVGLFGGVMSEP